MPFILGKGDLHNVPPQAIGCVGMFVVTVVVILLILRKKP